MLRPPSVTYHANSLYVYSCLRLKEDVSFLILRDTQETAGTTEASLDLVPSVSASL